VTIKLIQKLKLDLLALTLILLVYLSIVLVVSPFHEFPLNDDVMYAEAVRAFMETGQLKLGPWVVTSLILQVAYGAAVSKLLGFSFTILRLTTFALSLVSAGSLYAFLRMLNIGRVLSLCGALTLALNPVYLNLSYTFMSDVPVLTFMLLSLICYVRGLSRNSDSGMLAGSALATAALLIRQNAILLPIAASLSILFASPDDQKSRRLYLVLLSSGLPLVTSMIYIAWLTLIHGPTRGPSPFLALSTLFNPLSLTVTVLNHGFVTLEYVGLFIVPLLPLWFSGSNSGLLGAVRPRLLLLWAGLVVLGVLVMYLVNGKVMPYTGNILHVAGLGPLTLKDAVFERHLPLLRLPMSFWWLVTLLASLSAILIGSSLSSHAKRLVDDWRRTKRGQSAPDFHIQWLLWFATLEFLGVGLLSRYLFDRYLIALLVFLIPLFLLTVHPARWKNWAIAGTFVLLLSYGTFGVLGTRDYLAWNEARWAGIRYLISVMGVNPSNIDGGYEANYWYNYANATTKADVWWWIKEPAYCLTFTHLDGDRVAISIPYYRSLPPRGVDRIYVLECSDNNTSTNMEGVGMLAIVP